MKKDDPIMFTVTDGPDYGLTKRDFFAAMAM